MIDIKILRENPELIKENCAKRKYDVDIDALHDLDQQYLKLVRETEDLRAERNRLSKECQSNPAAREQVKAMKVELSEKEIEYINKSSTEKLPVEAGWHHLNGEQTLIHARNRRIGNGDWARTERQRNVMMAFLRRAREETSASSLASLVYNLIDDVETNMSPTQLVSLAIDVVLNGELSLNSRPVPFEKTWNYAWEGKMAVIHIDIEANKQKINEYLYGE